MKKYCRVALFLITAVFFSCSVPAFGQQTGLTGVITDTQGGVIPNANVVVNKTDGSTFTATTNQTGVYLLPSLLAGDYTITASAPNFSRVEKSILLLVGQLAQIDIVLPVGRASTSVVVEATSHSPSTPHLRSSPEM